MRYVFNIHLLPESETFKKALIALIVANRVPMLITHMEMQAGLCVYFNDETQHVSSDGTDLNAVLNYISSGVLDLIGHTRLEEEIITDVKVVNQLLIIDTVEDSHECGRMH